MKVKELKWVVDQLIKSGAEDFDIILSEEEIRLGEEENSEGNLIINNYEFEDPDTYDIGFSSKVVVMSIRPE